MNVRFPFSLLMILKVHLAGSLMNTADLERVKVKYLDLALASLVLQRRVEAGRKRRYSLLLSGLAEDREISGEILQIYL